MLRSTPLLVLTAIFSLTACQAPPEAPESLGPPLPADTASDDDFSEAMRRVAAIDRAFAPHPDGLAATHRGLGLHVVLDAGGARLSAPAGQLAVRFGGWGREGAIVAAEAAEPVLGACTAERDPTGACVRRAELHSAGAVEFWEGGEAGPRQSWELLERPPGFGPLTLELALDGAEAWTEGDAVRAIGADGGAWRFADLVATDATGAELNAWFEAEGDQIRVMVDDAGATWPITVDPVWTTAVRSWTGSGLLAAFGTAVSGGDFNGDGYADVAVGAPGVGGGAVYVFNGSSTGPASTASATLSGPTGAAYFGATVDNAYDINNDGYIDLIVGAPNSTTTATNDGAAWVFYGSASGLSNSSLTKLTGSLTASAYFGCSVAGAGDVNGDGFDDVIIGEYGYSTSTGRAWVYAGTASGISTTTLRTFTGAATNQRYGWSVNGGGSVTGDAYAEVAIGVPYQGSTYAGRAVVYAGASTFFTTTPTATTYTFSTANYQYGTAVLIEGSVNGDAYADLLVGAPYGASTGVGRVYYYQSTGSALPSGATRNWDGPGVGSAFGGTLAFVSDTDDDGYNEVLIGAPYYSSFAGYAALYDGASTGPASTTVVRTFTGTGTDYLGLSVAGLGDVNGDANGDLAIGSPGASTTFGTASVYLGGADADADGYVVNGSGLSEDCNDANSAIYPGSTEVCDAANADEDCDGTAEEAGASGELTFYRDADGDGYGDASLTTVACDAPVGYVANASDCNDADSAVHPAAPEVCDANDTDENCDGSADDVSAQGQSPWFADLDGDGYGDVASTLSACDAPTGFVSDDTDCDDGNGDINPGEAEVCDPSDTDENCDGSADDVTASGQSAWYEDGDLDGYGDSQSMLSACDAPGGYIANNTDCDDGDASIHPGATEVCDAVNTDEDCSGVAEESGAVGERAWYRDNDSDNYGNPNSSVQACDAPSGFVADATDCDDGSTNIHPGATEVCDANNTDEDCNGAADDSAAQGQTPWYADADSDNFGDAGSAQTACDQPTGHVANDDDCDDARGDVNPAANEVCDASNTDENCDGAADDASAQGQSPWYLDSDQDGFGDATQSMPACDQPTGYVQDRSDCDDQARAINPAATEVCDPNNTDEDCDRVADDPSALGQTPWYTDGDQDGYGDPANASMACDAPSGSVADATDCDDSDGGDFPGATELIANGDDEDCDGGERCYADADADGYRDGVAEVLSADGDCGDAGEALAIAPDGDCDDLDARYNPGAAETDCADPNDYNCDGSVGYEDNDGDGYPACQECDDLDITVFPGATEHIGDGIDGDCDGQEECWYDQDGDGYLDASGSTVSSSDADCADANEAPDTAPGGDCDDANAGARPGLPEVCDDFDVDEDCDGLADDASASGQLTWYADADFDGYGDPAAAQVACDAPSGSVADASDCDDTDGADHPGALEVVGNGDDEDCDGQERCLSDADDDGYRPDETELVSADTDCDDAGEALAAEPDGDCDDASASFNPGAAETDCTDPNDYNCDGSVGYADLDADGFPACEECDDGDANIYPGGAEIPGDLIDGDCDGLEICLLDNDDDGFLSGEGLTLASEDMDCADTREAASDEPGGDCDDANAAANPDAVDVPNDGVDQDCDGQDATDDTGIDDTGPDDSGPDDSSPDDSDGPDDSSPDDSAPDDTGTDGKDKDCGCASSGGGGEAAWLGAALLGLALRRRR